MSAAPAPGRRGGQPHAREDFGISSCGLTPRRPPDASRPGYPARRRAASLVACPGQTGPSVRWKLFSNLNGPLRLFPSYPPPVAGRNHHRGRRGGRQRMGTLGNVFDEKRIDPMIEVRGLTKRYGEKVAVNDLTFGVGPGKVTGFLGPNGAGKTTTMRLILGLDYPDAGTVSVDGRRQRPGQSDARGRRPARRQGGARRRAPTTTCCAWRRPTTCQRSGSTRYSTLSGYPR